MSVIYKRLMRGLCEQSIYVTFICLGQLFVGIWHLLAGEATERIFKQVKWVRAAGTALLLAALPCALWPTPYFIALGAVLAASGLLRAVNPQANVELQKHTLPRWGHGCVICGFAILAAAGYVLEWPRH